MIRCQCLKRAGLERGRWNEYRELMGLTLIYFVEHGGEDKHRVQGHHAVGLQLIEGAIVAREIVQVFRVTAAIKVVGGRAGPDKRGVVNTEGRQKSGPRVSLQQS
jgi:hypothetical protein